MIVNNLIKEEKHKSVIHRIIILKMNDYNFYINFVLLFLYILHQIVVSLIFVPGA